MGQPFARRPSATQVRRTVDVERDITGRSSRRDGSPSRLKSAEQAHLVARSSARPCVEMVHGGQWIRTPWMQRHSDASRWVGGLRAPQLPEQLLGELVEPLTDRLEVGAVDGACSGSAIGRAVPSAQSCWRKSARHMRVAACR